jgi:asparagine synthase (glutamine-hydrolysing)
VVLSGDGGDELFFGYSRYTSFLRQFNSNNGKFFREPLKNFVHILRHIPYLQRIESLEYNLTTDPFRILFWQLCFFTRDEKNKIFNLNINKNKDDLWLFKKFLNTDLPFTTALRLLDIKTYLADDILVKVDRATMNNSLEARPPLLDHQLIEYVFRIPDWLVYKNGTKKYLLKKSFEGKLPAEILNRKKKGFGSPIIHWFENGLYELALNSIKNGYLVKDGLLNFNGLEKLIKYYTKRRWYKLWSVLILEKWYEKWFYENNSSLPLR